jgi:pyruvate dehydrogenase E2 component (dihydrolipoamide acetyltransferase)
VRKIVAERMLHSLQSTAQLTLTASADARALLAYRERLKTSTPEHGLNSVSINDLVLFAVARALLAHPDLNATFDGAAITRHRRAHLAFAVDTPRGLLVPVIRDAGALSLKALSAEAKRLIRACVDGTVAPDALNGGTFTVSNLGALGIETFTPVLNPPQVGILGVGGIALKPTQDGASVAFHPHLALSLTINHQVIDGAPAARFLQTLTRLLADIDLLSAH